ncbi:MAG: ACP S-malonyltransferase [Aestuariibacter sp.]
MSKTAFVFPGQGSQSLGMLSELHTESDVVRTTFEEASEALSFNLWNLVANGPEDELNRTDNTQPALLAASVALWRYYLSLDGAKPDVMAGHSLGEYSALTCAGVISFADGLRLVKARGEFMQAAVPQGIGSMAAIIGLDDDKVIKACTEAAQQEIVSAVNFNSPGQVVIAGNKDAVDRASALCKEYGAKRALPLAVSVPSHCALMQPAAEKLAQRLNDTALSAAQIPVINNVDVNIESDSNKVKDALVRQLYCPVRWTETVQKMASDSVTTLAECGPGKVLTGLTKRIDKSLSSVAINTHDAIAAFIADQKG